MNYQKKINVYDTLQAVCIVFGVLSLCFIKSKTVGTIIAILPYFVLFILAIVFDSLKNKIYKKMSNQKKTEISTVGYMLNFGKHKGKSVNYVMIYDPHYILWIQDNHSAIYFSDDIVKKAKQNIFLGV